MIFLRSPSQDFNTGGPTAQPTVHKHQKDIIHSLTPYTKINSKWLKDLNIRQDTINFLEEIIDKTFSDINCTTVFLGRSLKAIEIKAKINKWKLVKLNTAKKTILKK